VSHQTRESLISSEVVSARHSAKPTPMRELEHGLLVKFELDNAGSSHKVRAARHIVRRGIVTGGIVPGVTTVIEKTGGSFGFGLVLACAEIQVSVELAVGLSFSEKKRRCLEQFGATLIGIHQLRAGATPREVVEWHLANQAELDKQYFYTDQFNNLGSLEAHELETGPEIATQLRAAWPDVASLTFVSCAGTGAHMTGITRALKAAGYQIESVLVEPAGCDSRNDVFVDHRLEGIAVGVRPPLLDWNIVDRVCHVTHDQMLAERKRFVKAHGWYVGNTSAACLCVAAQCVARSNHRHKVLTLAYDHGLWYDT